MSNWVFILCVSFLPLGWVLLRYGLFLLQYNPCLLSLLVRGSIDTFAAPLYCFCHVLLNRAYKASFGSAMYCLTQYFC